MLRILVVVLTVLACATRASAHPLDIGYLRLETKGARVDVALDLNPEAAGVLLGGGTKLDGDANLAPHAAALAAASFAREPITTPNGPCVWVGKAIATAEGTSVRIADSAMCPEGERWWSFPFVRDSKISATFELLVKETVDGEEKVRLVDRYESTYVFAQHGASSLGFLDFVWSGIEHIGAAPNQWYDEGGAKLPDGLDHILFLIALMLGGGRLLRLVGIATGFTVGHSVTLALAVTGVVQPPGSVIEPLIALSIAFAAAEAFVGKLDRHRWKIATAFGFIHGFGFAAALQELDLQSKAEMAKALFGYNLGVEIGQVGIVLVVAPLVILAHRNDLARRYVLRAIAAVIFVAGMYWFVDRIVG